MKTAVKRTLWVLAVLIGLPIVVLAALIVPAFAGLKPLAPREFGKDSILKDGIVGVGVIEEGTSGSVALIDAGNDPKGLAILAELKRRHLGPDAVDAIYITHGHPDHTAAAHLFPNAATYLGAGDDGIAHGTGRSHGPLTKLMSSTDAGLKNLILISADGDLPIGSKTVHAFLNPGHTQGSVAYLVDGLLFLGDSAGCTSEGKIRVAPYAMSDDQAQAARSLKRIADEIRARHMEVKEIVCAHSDALDGPQPLFDFADQVQ